jgi:hypothetical protein
MVLAQGPRERESVYSTIEKYYQGPNLGTNYASMLH